MAIWLEFYYFCFWLLFQKLLLFTLFYLGLPFVELNLALLWAELSRAKSWTRGAVVDFSQLLRIRSGAMLLLVFLVCFASAFFFLRFFLFFCKFWWSLLCWLLMVLKLNLNPSPPNRGAAVFKSYICWNWAPPTLFSNGCWYCWLYSGKYCYSLFSNDYEPILAAV